MAFAVAGCISVDFIFMRVTHMYIVSKSVNVMQCRVNDDTYQLL